MTIEAPHRLFTVDEYYRMAEAGILHEDDRVELIEGELIEMPPIGSPHAGTIDVLVDIFRLGLPREAAVVRIQNPIRLDERSEPQPDLVLARPSPRRYRDKHPEPADILLLIEVADSSLSYDRGVKVPLYARAGIPEYWIVDASSEVVEVYREPVSGSYVEQSRAGRGERVSPQAFPGLLISIDEIVD